MTTLVNKELFEYLTHLEEEINKRIFGEGERNLKNMLNSQMKKVINSEKEFLNYINPNGTDKMLSISPNGLPSIQSLKPDLEKMCELAKEERLFKDISKKYKENIEIEKGKKDMYVPVSKEDWEIELENFKNQKIIPKIIFAINEASGEKFELKLREDIYLKGYDKYSKKFPVLIREGNMKYHVVWNKLIDDIEENFYVPNTALVLQKRKPKLNEKVFEGLSREYKFNKKNYSTYYFEKIPFGKLKKWRPKDYSEFLSAGRISRVDLTESILYSLNQYVFKRKKIALEGVSKDELKYVLAFPEVLFKNSPEEVPKEEDLYSKEHSGKDGHLFNTFFDLVDSGTKKIGSIEYFLPRVCSECSEILQYNRGSLETKRLIKEKFNLESIRLNILGSEIESGSQFTILQRELRDFKKILRK